MRKKSDFVMVGCQDRVREFLTQKLGLALTAGGRTPAAFRGRSATRHHLSHHLACFVSSVTPCLVCLVVALLLTQALLLHRLPWWKLKKWAYCYWVMPKWARPPSFRMYNYALWYIPYWFDITLLVVSVPLFPSKQLPSPTSQWQTNHHPYS